MKPCVARLGHAEGEVAPGCRHCWLAEYSQRYRTLWGIPGPAKPVPEGSEFRPARRSQPPCRHLGPALAPAEAARLELGTVRTYRACALGHGQVREGVGYVCTCFGFPQGCKGCPDRGA